ncbi:hypothetical protein IAD21_00936 [Abditibacteriota bacterium]|nr:hypothetical protein IAD21_00936 [Abditibacteriota bacterium]
MLPNLSPKERALFEVPQSDLEAERRAQMPRLHSDIALGVAPIDENKLAEIRALIERNFQNSAAAAEKERRRQRKTSRRAYARRRVW